jgi:hypothetical protein
MGKKQPAPERDESDFPVAAVRGGCPNILAADCGFLVRHSISSDEGRDLRVGSTAPLAYIDTILAVPRGTNLRKVETHPPKEFIAFSQKGAARPQESQKDRH